MQLSGFVLGDIAAQCLTEPDFLLSRTLILGAYGFFIDAVAGHHFYDWLDANIEPGRAQTAKAGAAPLLRTISSIVRTKAYTQRSTTSLSAALPACRARSAPRPR